MRIGVLKGGSPGAVSCIIAVNLVYKIRKEKRKNNDMTFDGCKCYYKYQWVRAVMSNLFVFACHCALQARPSLRNTLLSKLVPLVDMNSHVVSSLVSELLVYDPHLDQGLATECCNSIANAGFTNLRNFFATKNDAVHELKHCSAGGKAALRRISKMANQKVPVSSCGNFKRPRSDNGKVSADALVKAVGVAKAMVVKRP